jgi:hypothetical protein
MKPGMVHSNTAELSEPGQVWPWLDFVGKGFRPTTYTAAAANSIKGCELKVFKTGAGNFLRYLKRI